jgi:hypothetical protein
LATIVVASCAAPTPRPSPQPSGAELPLAPYQAALGTHDVYRLNPDRSRVDIIVRRAGALRQFGHDHVITAREVTGYVRAGNDEDSRADLLVDLRELRVDEAAAREVFGLDTEPSDADIAGTAENMQQKVLQTETWHYAQIAVSACHRDGEWARCDVMLTLKANSHTLPVDVLLEYDEAQLSARGLFTVLQTDLGIEPFSLFGGALSVRDQLLVYFQISAAPFE